MFNVILSGMLPIRENLLKNISCSYEQANRFKEYLEYRYPRQSFEVIQTEHKEKSDFKKCSDIGNVSC